MDLKGKLVLITQSRLVDFTGSEIITLELSEYFSSHGAGVVIWTSQCEDPIKLLFNKIANVKIITGLNSDKLQKLLKARVPDLVWVHHQIIPPFLLDESKYEHTRFIFNHMSSYHFQEFPILNHLEEILADKICFNSKSTQDIFIQSGVFTKKTSHRFTLLNNAAPKEFFVSKKTKSPVLKKILVVSNHIPSELADAIADLRSMGYFVEVAGVSHLGQKSYRRITPAILRSFDVVITIGKTVQYAIAIGLPVYCYDHFGGPGYLNHKNYQVAMYNNFSGRGFKQKSKDEIVNEITSSYEDAINSIDHIKNKYSVDFDLEETMPSIINIRKKTQHKSISTNIKQVHQKYFELQQNFLEAQILNEKKEKTINLLNHEKNIINDQMKKQSLEIQALQQQIDSKDLLISNLSSNLENIKNSRSYKIAKKSANIKNATFGLWRKK